MSRKKEYIRCVFCNKRRPFAGKRWGWYFGEMKWDADGTIQGIHYRCILQRYDLTQEITQAIKESPQYFAKFYIPANNASEQH